MLKVCLSHDIDRIVKSHQYLTHAYRAIKGGDLHSFKKQMQSIRDKKPYWGFDQLVEIESRYNARSTVFFLNESIKASFFNPKTYKLALGRYNILEERVVDIIRYLDTNGWEIGVHGSYNSYCDEELLLYEKKALEEILGHEVYGVRQHYLNLDEKTWKLQERVGFKYDASFGYRDRIGYKDGKISPFSPNENHFFVFPLPLMDQCFVNLDDKWEHFDELLGQCEKHDGVLVINFHQHTFYGIDFPGYKETYIQIIEKCINAGARFLTLGEYYNDYLCDSKKKHIVSCIS